MGTLYVVMGQSRTRKSATIRALTGFTQGNPWQVAVEDSGPISVFVISASPQEDRKAFDRGVERIGKEKNAYDVLLALHPDKRAVHFIRKVQEIIGPEMRWVLLGMDSDSLSADIKDLSLDPDVVIPDSRDLPANAIAYKVRSAWGWL